MRITRGTIVFNRDRGFGPRTSDTTVEMDGDVAIAEAILTGFNARIGPRGRGRPLGMLDVRLSTEIDDDDPREVKVTATFGLRDWSGDWDDEYEGEIHFAVIGE